MNLLPRPRSARLGPARVPVSEPAVVIDPTLPDQGYHLTIGDGGVGVRAGDPAGAFYARATLAQLALIHDGQLPVGQVEDWPDLAVRGVMLDISRDKVPTMDTLRSLIDRLASWKVNQVQLYTEHTFAYADHEEVWRDASPVTAGEVDELEVFCAERHVELVPNQNCLGHFDRWLRHDRYRPLAIVPDGYLDRGRHRPPTTLDPAKPASLALVRGLLGELVPSFGSRTVHVGLDEPFELPANRTGEYLDWVRTLRRLPELDDRRMLIWGDILALHPELAAALPEQVTVCEWGYEAGHPWNSRLEVLAEAGVPCWTCPGTSSWQSIVGRWTNACTNIAEAVDAALAYDRGGMLNTDWGDLGHLQHLPVSEPGLAWGAAQSWCRAANRGLDLAVALDTHAYGDGSAELGSVAQALGDVHRRIGPQFPNLSSLMLPLYFPQVEVSGSLVADLSTAQLDDAQAVADDAVIALGRARPSRVDGGLVVEEFRAGAALVNLMCRDVRARLAGDGTLAGIPGAERSALAASLAPLIDQHRSLWLARNRPGGLDDSAGWLEHLEGCYRSGVADEAWGGW
jgi:hexosaminidase